jgi:hypothetical protein
MKNMRGNELTSAEESEAMSVTNRRGRITVEAEVLAMHSADDGCNREEQERGVEGESHC